MNCNFKEIKLSDVTTLITKGTTPTTVGCSFENTGINFIRSECIGNSRRLDNNRFLHISSETNEKLKRSKIVENDILFSMAGMFLGKTAIVTKDDCPANTNQAVAIIRVDKSLVDFRYVYYYLNQKKVVRAINSNSSQSAQPNINLKQIGDLLIDLPDLDTQNQIVKILDCIDNKIELNNKINDNLFLYFTR